MIEMTLKEKMNQPLPIMKQKEYRVLYELMLKNHMLKNQDQVQEEIKKPQANIL